MSVVPSNRSEKQGKTDQLYINPLILVNDTENIQATITGITHDSSQLEIPQEFLNSHNEIDIDEIIEDSASDDKSQQTSTQQDSHVVAKQTKADDLSKVSLKFKHSTKWLPSIKKKTAKVFHTSDEIINSINDEKLEKRNNNTNTKTSKRMSLTTASFIPKRFSSLSTQNIIVLESTKKNITTMSASASSSACVERSTKSPKLPPSQALSSPPLSPNRSLSNIPIIISTSPTTSLTQPPVNSTKLDRNTSFSSSTPSEKSTIGKSLNALKRTTKSILFLETYSNGSASQISTADNSLGTKEYLVEYDHEEKEDESGYQYNNETVVLNDDDDDADDDDDDDDDDGTNDFNDMQILRRSISYTDADRKKIISFITDLPEKKSNRQTSTLFSDASLSHKNKRNLSSSFIRNELTKDLDNRRSPLVEDTKSSHNRQRSKTMDNCENPLLELTGSNNTSLFSSLANFVKINRTVSSTSIKTANSPVKPLSFDSLSPNENEKPADFLQRLLKIYPLTLICEILSNEDNNLLEKTLEEYMQEYDFKNEPLDFALRKFLMLNYLPKETQQIDRVIYQFSKWYYECNKDLGFDQDTLYILTYSLIMVHTDKFNPNNKKKMSRFDFIQNVINAIKDNENSSGSMTGSTLIIKELLGYFYDNITYCPLIKISGDQSTYALEALNSTLPFPYPNMSFLNGSTSNKEYDYKKGSISSTPSSSSSINRSTSQTMLTIQPPLRKKSSSFLWSGTPSFDPYEYIVKNDPIVLNELKLLNDKEFSLKLSSTIPFLSTENIVESKPENPSLEMIEKQLFNYKEQLRNEIDASLLKHCWKTLTERSVSFTLKISKKKGSYLVSSDTHIIPLNDGKGDEYYLTRVFKVGIIDKQESNKVPSATTATQIPVPTPALNDMSPIDSSKSGISKNSVNNRSKNKIWKPYFCILTAVGMFFYEDVALFRMRFCGINPLDGKNIVVIEEASSNKVLMDLLKSKPPEYHTSINSSNDSQNFISFPYFKSDKVDSKEKDNIEFKKMKPSFILSPDSFATRKNQNIEYDEVVNKRPVNPPPSSTLNKSSTKLLDETVSLTPSDLKFSDPTQPILNRPTLSEKRCSTDDIISVIDEKIKNGIKPAVSLKYTFFIYGKNSKNIYMVSSLAEAKSWIHNINIVSALDGVKIEYEPLDFTTVPKDWKHNISGKSKDCKYYEVTPSRYLTIDEKLKGGSFEFEHNTSNDPNTLTENKIETEKKRTRSNTTSLPKVTSSKSTFKLSLLSEQNENIETIFKSDVELSAVSSGQNISDHLSTDSNSINTNASIKKINVEENLENKEKEVVISNSRPNTPSISSTKSSIPSETITIKNNIHLNLLEHLYSVHNLTQVMPLQKKTRDELLSTAKILSVKLEWLWYEKCKKETITLILERMLTISKDTS